MTVVKSGVPSAPDVHNALTTPPYYCLLDQIKTTIFAYVVGELVSVILQLDPADSKRKQQLRSLNQYLYDFSSTRCLRRSVRLHVLHSTKFRSVFDERQFLPEMPPELRIQVLNFTHASAMLNLPVICAFEEKIRGAFSVLMQRLRPYHFSGGDSVVHPVIGQVRELFFVTNGKFVCQRYGDGAADEKSDKIDEFFETEFFGEVSRLIAFDISRE